MTRSATFAHATVVTLSRCRPERGIMRVASFKMSIYARSGRLGRLRLYRQSRRHLGLREGSDGGRRNAASRFADRPAPGERGGSGVLSPAFAGRLKEFGPWFEYLDRFRRALEHEVPLYNALEALPADRLRRFRELAGRIEEAQRRRDQAEVDRLTDASNGVVSFFPITAHAFGENARREFVQFQMASDFDTVEEIARRLLVEFD